MFNSSSFSKAKASHALDVDRILKHLSDSSHLKSRSIVIDLKSKKIIEEKIKSLKLENSKGVYGFFVKQKDVELMQERLKFYREKKRSKEMKFRQAVPRPNSENDTRNGCLYIGMIRENNLENRILEHLLGTKSPRTGALKLHLWGKELKSINLSYIEFHDEKEHSLICEYEKAMWKYYQPAIGKL